MQIKAIEQKLKINKSYIFNEYMVRDLGVFGSYIKHKQTKESDIDILIDFKKGNKSFFNFMRLKAYLEKLLKNDIDLVMKDALKPRLRNKILNEVKYV
jgi:hypothetical protein